MLALAALLALPALQTLHPRHGIGNPPVRSFVGVPHAPELASRDAAPAEIARPCPVCLALSQVRAGLADGVPVSWTGTSEARSRPTLDRRIDLPRAPRLPGSGPRAPPRA